MLKYTNRIIHIVYFMSCIESIVHIDNNKIPSIYDVIALVSYLILCNNYDVMRAFIATYNTINRSATLYLYLSLRK